MVLLFTPFGIVFLFISLLVEVCMCFLTCYPCVGIFLLVMDLVVKVTYTILFNEVIHISKSPYIGNSVTES